MIKLGILDFDTSHVVAFTQRLNHKGVPEEQWVQGAKIVVGCPGDSKIQPERIREYKKTLEQLGVPLVDKPEEMISKVDGMLIESQQGGVHYEKARPFLEAGIPCFIDKPLASTTADARKIVELADKKRTPIFSSSSLRFAPEVVQYQNAAAHGKVVGVLSHGPAGLHAGNPGLFHYGIHAVELLYALMGPGCVQVSCTFEKGAEVVTGQWRDGRLAGVRGLRAGAASFGFLAFAEKGVQHVAVGTTLIYRELLKKIVAFFETKKSPVALAETVEIIAFIEAALKSVHNHGTAVSLAV